MKKIALFTTDKNYEIKNYIREKYIVYIFIVKLHDEIEKLIPLLDVDEYLIEPEINHLLEKLRI